MAAIVYNSGTPEPGDTISSTQPKIKANFTGINTWTAIDHEEFESVDAGKHKKVTLIAQGGAPAFTNATDLGMWNAVGGTSGKQEVYIAKTTNNTRVNVAMTESSISDAAGANSGYSYLPSGLILQWCTLVVTANKDTENSYPFTFPLGGSKTIAFPNEILSLNISQVDEVSAGVFLTISKSGANQFTVKTYATLSTQSITLRCLIIGY